MNSGWRIRWSGGGRSRCAVPIARPKSSWDRISRPPGTRKAPTSAGSSPTIDVVSYTDVAPTAKEQAVPLLRQLGDKSRRDAGAMRVEILQRTAPSNQFVILAVWKDQPSLDGHAASTHASEFREK